MPAVTLLTLLSDTTARRVAHYEPGDGFNIDPHGQSIKGRRVQGGYYSEAEYGYD